MGDGLTEGQLLEGLSSPQKKSDFCGLLNVFLYISQFQWSGDTLASPSPSPLTPHHVRSTTQQRQGDRASRCGWAWFLWIMPCTSRMCQLKEALSGRGSVAADTPVGRAVEGWEGARLTKTLCFSTAGLPVGRCQSLPEWWVLKSEETPVFFVVIKRGKIAGGLNISTNKFFLWDVWLSANFTEPRHVFF